MNEETISSVKADVIAVLTGKVREIEQTNVTLADSSAYHQERADHCEELIEGNYDQMALLQRAVEAVEVAL